MIVSYTKDRLLIISFDSETKTNNLNFKIHHL